MRIEDVDRTRADPECAARILDTLECHGLWWDGPVLRQSARDRAYQDALDRLAGLELLYPCTCTRSELPPAAGPDGEARYPGTCRLAPSHRGRSAALRLRTPPGSIEVRDRLRGAYAEDVAATAGDFVLRRRDGSYAYPLAVVVDDAAQGISDVVRGADLWHHSARQRLLQQLLGLPAVRYLHVPLVVEPDGAKLSKSRRSVALGKDAPRRQLAGALTALNLPPPPDLRTAPVAEMLQWALQHWSPLLPGLAPVPAWD